MIFVQLFFWLVVAHALCDYPLQGDFLSRAKNPFQPIPGVPFYQALLAHAVIHGGGVALITGSVPLGCLETLVHACIDLGKCEGWFGFNVDQALHIGCKVMWILLLVWGSR